MKLLTAMVLVVAAMTLSGCLTAKEFFGASNPCMMAENAYTGFLAITAVQPVSSKAMKAANAGIAAVREQCADGQIDKVTLNKAVNAYIQALTVYRK